jgi:cytochrome c2
MRRAPWLAAMTTIALASATPAAAQKAGDATVGEDLFFDRCAMCHVAEGGGEGPSLTGVLGRKAASAPGFPYSDALKAFGKVWTAAELDVFLSDPGKAVPGTAMPLKVPGARERAALISYLAAHP